jgi:hypothetical protein
VEGRRLEPCEAMYQAYRFEDHCSPLGDIVDGLGSRRHEHSKELAQQIQDLGENGNVGISRRASLTFLTEDFNNAISAGVMASEAFFRTWADRWLPDVEIRGFEGAMEGN